MSDEAIEGKKTTVLARVERLRELLEEDAPGINLEAAYNEIGRELDGLIRPGRAEGVAAELVTGQGAPMRPPLRHRHRAEPATLRGR